ncbi:MAG: hydrogenase accessory protein HypB [Chlamydiae bacterium]|nr:MAG: hydrogenase accessory protein HypB [Chlamydiota bacterium]
MCEECGCNNANTKREIKIEENVLAKNDAIAEEIRAELVMRKSLMINMLSSPGSGKTTLLEKSLPKIMGDYSLAVIEGDVQTRYDAERLRRLNIPASQLNTGGACHLDAQSVKGMLSKKPFNSSDIIIIENVGNLVCPSAFDLGEDAKIVSISVTEGDDKPEKYPAAFAAASLMLITKIDLLPYVQFDVERCKEGAWQIHPGLPIIALSSITGEGVDKWIKWLLHELNHKKGYHHHHH